MQRSRAPLPDELDGVDQLTPYAAGLRYDDDVAGAVDRETALRWATAALNWARQQIKSRPQEEAEPLDDLAQDR